MSHIVIITTPPGDSLVPDPVIVKVTVEYSPAHGLTPDQEHRNIEKIERRSAKFYAKLQQLLSDPDLADE
jgi:hypothetical protein